MKELLELREARRLLVGADGLCYRGVIPFEDERRAAWERWHAAVEAFNRAIRQPLKEAA